MQPPGGGNAASSQPAGTSNESPATQPAHKSGLHEFIDNAAEALTSPFSGLTSASHSEWIIRGVGTLAAVLFYGLALGFAGRLLRVRGERSSSGASVHVDGRADLHPGVDRRRVEVGTRRHP